jgi:leucyl-tRNA synthetase
MHKKFDSSAIEKKWQEAWKQDGLYDVGQREVGKEKEYVLVEWPYPSGNLHIGHWYAFAVPDIYVRYRRMTGTQVIYPMGFDAFGLPAENAAIKRNLDPKAWTNDNIAFMRGQLESMGNAFTWNKTTSSTDPDYYRWTQWMFTEFFRKGIAYRGQGTVNWCPGCNTVIANEQVLADGTCERSGDVIVKRQMPQWMLKITDYADRLIDDLDALDWPEHIKEAQRQWIGRSKGAEIDFTLSTGEKVTVFTTRPDTLYGVTYLVLAPEHPLIAKNQTTITNWDEVSAYVQEATQRDEQDRLDATKEKTGVRLAGITATNPANGEVIPIFVADYVIGSYGTGAIMAVPAHDERDGEFAKKFDLPIRSVVSSRPITHAGALLESKIRPGHYLLQLRSDDAPKAPGMIAFFGGGLEADETPTLALTRELQEELELDVATCTKRNDLVIPEVELPDRQCLVTHLSNVDESTLRCHEGNIIVLTIDQALSDPRTMGHVRAFLQQLTGESKIVHTEPGVLIKSAEFDGMDSEEAKEAIVKKVGGRMTNTYRLRDWSIGRQRYWGVPIPIVYDPEGKAHPVPAEHLPWLLPEDVDFKPTGEAPLAKSEALRKRTEELFGKGWTPEVETMDTFVDSSWYFLRYVDNQNKQELSNLDTQKDWLPVDIYFGGAEHTTMHLLYSRFWQKVLFDLGLAAHPEPYKKRINRGLILGPDGNKMSKSKGNVIDPDEQVKLVGADTVKMYLAFMGPYEGNNYPWDMGGIAGLRRFLERVNGLTEHLIEAEPEVVTRQLHKTIQKVGGDIVEYKFNTAISAMMIFVNLAEKEGLTAETFATFLRVLAPFAPHLTEELWHELGHTTSIHLETFPEANAALATDTEVTIGVQINGKMRGTITIAPDAPETEALSGALTQESIKGRLGSAAPQKVIYIPGKILNLIITEQQE